MASGLCDLGLGCPKLGYVRLSEILQALGRLHLVVKRDLGFTEAGPMSAYAAAARRAEPIVELAMGGDHMTSRRELPTAEALGQMSMTDFVSAWRSIVGEPPAVMLENRAEMICILDEAIQDLLDCGGQKVKAHSREDVNENFISSRHEGVAPTVNCRH